MGAAQHAKEVVMNRNDQQPLARRTLLAGAGTAGALVAAASLLPGDPASPPAHAAEAPVSPEPAMGYRLTEHVQRYYRTARV
jgi:hypothetical protein